jgi:hypothetical protein
MIEDSLFRISEAVTESQHLYEHASERLVVL